jgi:hypothetical protein
VASEYPCPPENDKKFKNSKKYVLNFYASSKCLKSYYLIWREILPIEKIITVFAGTEPTCPLPLVLANAA